MVDGRRTNARALVSYKLTHEPFFGSGEIIKALISCNFSLQLICTNIFAYAKVQFSHDAKVGFEGV